MRRRGHEHIPDTVLLHKSPAAHDRCRNPAHCGIRKTEQLLDPACETHGSAGWCPRRKVPATPGIGRWLRPEPPESRPCSCQRIQRLQIPRALNRTGDSNERRQPGIKIGACRIGGGENARLVTVPWEVVDEAADSEDARRVGGRIIVGDEEQLLHGQAFRDAAQVSASRLRITARYARSLSGTAPSATARRR